MRGNMKFVPLMEEIIHEAVEKDTLKMKGVFLPSANKNYIYYKSKNLSLVS